MTSVLTLLGVGIGSTACAVALTLAPPLPVNPPAQSPDRARAPDGHAQCDPPRAKWWTPPYLHQLKPTAATTTSLRISSKSSGPGTDRCTRRSRPVRRTGRLEVGVRTLSSRGAQRGCGACESSQTTLKGI